MDGITYLGNEIDRNSDRAEIDLLPTIREAISLADKGALDVKLKLPNGRRLTVKTIIKRFALEKYVRDWSPEFV